MNIEKIQPKQDNVLVRLRIHAMATEDEKTEGGIFLPKARNEPGMTEAVEATVIAVGPGHYADKWLGHEEGTAPDGSKKFIPVDSAICKGARVLIRGSKLGDRVYSDERAEYRMILAHAVEAVLE